MNRSFNVWWLLPVITGVIGVILALILAPVKVTQTINVDPVEPSSTSVNHLSVTEIALPPEPVFVEPVLTATIKNNRVVLNNDSNNEISTKAPVQLPEITRVDIDNVDLDESSTLASKFSQVMEEMANEAQDSPHDADKLHAQTLTQHPQWYQDLVPELDFSSHIYASDKNERWVRVNNQVVQEGELITSTMRLISIEPQQVIIEMHERRFTLPALTNW